MTQEVTVPSYRSFLVRLWQEAGASRTEWRGEVEHIQSGAQWRFMSLMDLLAFLAQQGGSADLPESTSAV